MKMKAFRIALLMLGALFAACTSEEIIEEPQQDEAAKVVHFTATLAPKDDGSTRAVDENGVTTWVVGERIAICYQKTDGTRTKVRAEVTSVNDTTGVATIEATLAGAADTIEAKFIYPYSLATNEGEINKGVFCNQNGLLTGGRNDISSSHDLATSKDTILVTGSAATVNGNVGMKNKACICKFNLTLENLNASANYYDISIVFDGGDTYNLSLVPKNRLGSVYVAMLPVTSAKAIITAKGYTSDEVLSSDVPLSINCVVIPSVTLEAGKFYRNVPVTLGLPKDLRGGSIVASDYDIITSYGDRTSNTITIPNGFTVRLSYVNILPNTAGIICPGNATIILDGTNNVTSVVHYPAIQAGGNGTTLTIDGFGSLTATGGEFAAGIGSGYFGSCGDITITGGAITATGGVYAAGIGSGDSGSCGDITITNGVTRVTAIKGADASFSIGYGNNGSCGEITIGGMMYYDGFAFPNGGAEYLFQSPLVYEP